jgi:glutamate-1-semialdehyde 2,1-aminomutase
VKTERSKERFEEAKRLIPGGVNSPVRAFKSVGGGPRFIDRGRGAHVWDIDGNRYVDYVLSWGPLALGHAHPSVVAAIETAARRGTSYGAPTEAETRLARLVIDTVSSIEMIRFVNSGTEATMSALRLARAYTGRDKIVKFSGCYHGHADMLLVKAGSGVATLGLPDSPGVPAGTTADTIVAPYNDLDGVAESFKRYQGRIAAVIVEPVAGNMGFVKAKREFLEGLQTLCRENGALFVLDEVMTGFRAAPGGAQALFDLDPDLTCLGKVIGGGLPVGAYAGKRKIMENVAPQGPVYQAGTLSGNPLAMAAGLATLEGLLSKGVFDAAAARTAELARGITRVFESRGVPVQGGDVGTMFGVYFLAEPGVEITSYETAKRFADTKRYGRFFQHMLDRGFYFAPSQFEAGFVSSEHTAEDVGSTLAAAEEFAASEKKE